MSKRIRAMLAIVGAFMLILVTSACSGGDNGDKGGNGESVKVGILLPQTGGTGETGSHVTEAIKMVIDDLNSKGGVLGKQIKAIVKDDQSTPAVGVSRANELVKDEVVAVFEGYNSPVVLAQQPVFARAGIMDITLIAQNDAIVDGGVNPDVVRLNANSAQASEAIVDILKRTGARKVVFLSQNDAFGDGSVDTMKAVLKKKYPDIDLAEVIKFPLTQTDFRVSMSKVKDANPDAVVAVNSSVDSGMPSMMKQFKSSGISADFVATVGGIVKNTLDAAGGAANGAYSADYYFPGAGEFASNPSTQYFVKKWAEDHPDTELDRNDVLGITGVQVWAEAVEKAGSFDRHKVASAIQGQSFKGTFLGDVDFKDSGQMQSKLLPFQVVDGKFKVLD